jgi:hypothetical protein
MFLPGKPATAAGQAALKEQPACDKAEAAFSARLASGKG